jgi:protein TonB
MGEPSAVELTDILLPPPPSVKPTEPPSPPSRPTVRDLVPVVVPDHVPLEHMVPSMDELSLADPGITSQGGHPDAPHTGSPSSRGSDVSAPAPEQSLTPEPEVFDFRSVEVAAEYPGGQKALQRFLERNLQDPGELMEDGKRVRVLVRFIVGASGLAGSFELLQSGGRAYDQEVLRVLNRMPRWNPARQNGRDVPMYFTIPVVFALPDRE